jgi:hypothetical protein
MALCVSEYLTDPRVRPIDARQPLALVNARKRYLLGIDHANYGTTYQAFASVGALSLASLIRSSCITASPT